MSVTFGRDDLQYNPQHGVLICRECQYAIQKSAVDSHLLRHKIYRGERQRLLSSVGQLRLLEPDEVQLPPTGTPPVEGLPVLSGYRCTADGCGSLWASVKRMRRHWAEAHGVNEPPDGYAQPANLQTFFRGTKLRYFEVSTLGAPPEAPASVPEPSHRHDHDPEAMPPSHLQICTVDLETLRYFHHFVTTTSLTLPSRHPEPAKYWQVDVVAQALRLHWLMSGLLALSATHLATLSDDETTKHEHLERSGHFKQCFSAGWTPLKSAPDFLELDEARTGAQMICIQRCFLWTAESSAVDHGLFPEWAPFQVSLFLSTIRGCADPGLALQHLTDDESEPITVDIPDPTTEDSLAESQAAPQPSRVPPALLENIRTLPNRMGVAVGRPDSAMDFFAALAAVDVLVRACGVSFASDDLAAAWAGMEAWPRRVSAHFLGMVRGGATPALVVLAYWSSLVERAEGYCWFLRGLAARLLGQIARDIPADSPVHGLIRHLTR